MVVKACYNLSQLKLSICPAFVPIVGSAARLVFGVVGAD